MRKYLKEQFARIFKKDKPVKKYKLVTFKTDWESYFDGKELI